MLSTDLKQGRSYRFDVIKEKSNRKFFKVSTDDGVEFSLLKFRFQQKQPIPDSIDCYVKSLMPITLGQDISVFINDFYTEGKDYDFKVKGVKNDTTKVYELEDGHDLCFKLFNAPESLAIGSRVKCKVLKIKGVQVTLKYIGTLATRLPLQFFNFQHWFSNFNMQRSSGLYKNLIESLPEFNTVMAKYRERHPDWIIDLIHTVATHIPDWLIQCKDDRSLLAKTVGRMRKAREMALFILEESDFLRKCDQDQRAMLQSKLSDCVELFDQYELAASRILDKTYEEFIDQMFSRLKKAGYLFRPSKQFRIMMTILKLRPELINARMGELFEALHNWEIGNWQSEPFRGALVEQLQIFIRENCGQINLLPANDSSDNNKAVIRMIMAIAVQSILATEEDNVDLHINRAMLYRYISYLYPKDVHTLLGKGVDSILGLERPSEFGWNDTDHPTLLMEKSLYPADDTDERNNLVKVYSTSKASLFLRPGSLQLIARGANPEETSVPNRIIEWLSPVISLNDDIVFPSPKKAKDLKSYSKMWDDVSWSIFGEEQSAGEKIEKILPYGGEDVKVVIDDIEVSCSNSDKQLIKFHCTIYDETYHGDGWMRCDPMNMLRWLTGKDIPVNYDGSLKFAKDENGNSLLFRATVRRKNNTLEFSMKSQIEDCLLESIWPGEESTCIVTHLDRPNNSWLCLSELGCTFKVPYDEMTEGLNIGRIVRVKYVEPDRSGNSIEFFIGELSEDQEGLPHSIRKSDCLNNLMHSLGEVVEQEEENDSEVVEVEEVMSKEELLELIYMFQRCAYTEKEYLKAFNYLGFASILSRLAEEEMLLDEISTHMDLLQLLQDFGKNQKVDLEWLAGCGEKVKFTPMLERLHTRLKIVSNLYINENSEWLWAVRQNPRNETEQRLASLVLSFNMLPGEMEDTRKEVMKEITTLLNVNSTVSSSKFYGDESQTVEFKSSLIFHTQNGGRADPKAQMFEIVHIIAGFMNARGGSLFIGVNDAGYENGLYDDLSYRKAHGQKATIDAMIVDLQNHLDRIMPPHAKDHWEIESDSESKKGVIIVKVLPVEQPVEVDGVIYVRSSSTTKPRLGDQRDEFIRNRSQNFDLLMKIWGVGGADDDKSLEEGKSQESVSVTDSSTSEETEQDSQTVELTDEAEAEKTDSLSTGRHRANALHSYDANYVDPAFYLYFKDGDSVTYSPNDSYLDYDKDCRLALAVTEKEKEGCMTLAYSDGSVVCIDLSVFSEFSPNESRPHDKESRLEYVNIGLHEDYLLSVVKAPYGAVFYRIDPISGLKRGNTVDAKGGMLCDNKYRILAQEIVSADKLPFFDSDSVGKEPRYFGVQLPKGDGTLTVQECIDELLRPVACRE